MRKPSKRPFIGTLVLALAFSGAATGETWWVPIMAHAPGVSGSQWRSDVTVLSLCDASSDLELRVHHGSAVTSRRVELPARSQRVFQDVLSGLLPGDAVGGMTAIYHRRFYPDDVDATVAYVAPSSFGAPDPRYAPFLESVGPADCRFRVEALQQILLRRQAMLARLAQRPTLRFTRIGGANAALESIALEAPFTFWQYHGVTACAALPLPSASDEAICLFAQEHVGVLARQRRKASAVRVRTVGPLDGGGLRDR